MEVRVPLIQCPDCNSEISDRAAHCIKCGCPVEPATTGKPTNLGEIDIGSVRKFLSNRSDLKIGRQIVNWTGTALLKNADANFDREAIRVLNPGKIMIVRHKNGLRLKSGIASHAYDIHFGQIADFRENDAEEWVKQNKSVIGRGIAGGILLGPAAAVVGAMSALKTEALKKLTVIQLTFLSPENHEPTEIVLKVPRGSSLLFTAKVQSEITRTRPDYKKRMLELHLEVVRKTSPAMAKTIEDKLKEMKT